MKGVIRGHGNNARYFLDGQPVTREEFFSFFSLWASPARMCACGHHRAAHEGHTVVYSTITGLPERQPTHCSACPCRQYEEAAQHAGASLVAFKPLASDALAVHPDQVAEATEDARRKGVPVEFLPDGRPVFTSSRQFRDYAQVRVYPQRLSLMANEISISLSLSVYKSTVMVEPVSRSVASAQFTMTGTTYISGVISVGFAAEEAIPIGEVTAPHWAFFRNHDATNFISLRPGSAAANAIRLKAGEYALVPLNPAVVWYAIADTAACKLEYLIFDV